MNALTPTDTISPETLEHVLGTGDISKLTVPQRVEFYKAACRSLGLNPLTRPIRFLSFQGQQQAYFTRDGTDQLRKGNKITLHVVDKQLDGDVYVVTVRARMPDGREDEDIGAVPLGKLQGDARANALMKCLTKAKRRVTLSICGLGWASEDELDTMQGVQTYDAEAEPPRTPAQIHRAAINAAAPVAQPASYPSPQTAGADEAKVDAKIKELAEKFANTDTLQAHHRLVTEKEVSKAIAWLRDARPTRYKKELEPFIDASFERNKPQQPADLLDEDSAAEPEPDEADMQLARAGA